MVEEKNSHSTEEVKSFADVKDRFLSSVRRNKGKLTVAIIVISVLLLGVVVKLFTYSSSSGFCVLLCHEMRPEYRTWKMSLHAEKEVECHDCHFEPGFLGKIKAKWRAKGQMISHLFGGYLDNTLEKAQKENIFLEVQNIHQQGERRFYIKSDAHGLKITNDNCRRCHPDITAKEVITEVRGVRVAHKVHVEEQKLVCTDCHINIVHGEEPQKRNLPKMRICFRCHKEAGSDKKLSMTNCKNCHLAQESMWAGKGGFGVKTVTSTMYGSVECSDCHTRDNGFKKPKDSSICLDCHDKEEAESFYVWKEKLKVERLKLEERINTVAEKIAYARERKDLTPEQKATIDSAESIYNEAKQNLSLVNQDGSNGVHNNAYALSLIEVGRKKLQESLSILP